VSSLSSSRLSHSATILAATPPPRQQPAIDLAGRLQDHCVFEVAERWVAGAGERDGYAAASAGGAHQPRLWARERKARLPRASQSVAIERLATEAPPRGLRAFTAADGFGELGDGLTQAFQSVLVVSNFGRRRGSEVSDGLGQLFA
jgi:hypothetical protein